MRLDQLRRLSALLDAASGPQDVFMALRDRSLHGPARDQALARELQGLLRQATPERFMGNPPAQDLARELSARLQSLYERGLAGLVEPVGPGEDVGPVGPVVHVEPGEVRAAPPRALEIRAGGNRYVLTDRVGQGDVAAIYRGHCLEGAHAGREVAGKVALARADGDLMLAEIQALRLLGSGDARQRDQVPALLDVFTTGAGHAGLVMPWLPGLDGVALRARFPAGVPPEHVIWIGRRLLSVTGHAHSLGLVHANIEPAHIVVRAHDHHVSLIDWCFSTRAVRGGAGFRVFNPDYSAPEVQAKPAPLPTADLYSIGRCLLFLLGGDLASGTLPEQVPARLRRFVAYLTRTSPLQRAQDAWEMFDELDRTRAAIYGPHTFRELVVP